MINKQLRIKHVLELIPRGPTTPTPGRNKKVIYECVKCGCRRKWTIAEVDRIDEGSLIVQPCKCGSHCYTPYNPMENQTHLERFK